MERHGTRSSVNRGVMQMVVSAMMLALAVLLDFVVAYIPGLNWPNGGTITIAMLPLFLVGFLCGPFWGFSVSLLFGVLDIVIGSAWAFNWASILLDYILGFGVCGVCGFFCRSFYRKSLAGPVSGMVLSGALRFLCSFLSGCVVMWDIADTGTFDPHFDVATVTYSAVYNLGYILPSIVLSIIVFCLISKPIFLLSDSRVLASIRPKSTEKDAGKRQGFLSKIGFDVALPYLSAILLLCGALSCIPTISYVAAGDSFVVDFLALAYVSIVFASAILVYAFVRLALLPTSEVKKTFLLDGISGERSRIPPYIWAIFLSILAIAVSAVAIYVHFAYGIVIAA